MVPIGRVGASAVPALVQVIAAGFVGLVALPLVTRSPSGLAGGMAIVWLVVAALVSVWLVVALISLAGHLRPRLVGLDAGRSDSGARLALDESRSGAISFWLLALLGVALVQAIVRPPLVSVVGGRGGLGSVEAGIAAVAVGAIIVGCVALYRAARPAVEGVTWSALDTLVVTTRQTPPVPVAAPRAATGVAVAAAAVVAADATRAAGLPPEVRPAEKPAIPVPTAEEAGTQLAASAGVYPDATVAAPSPVMPPPPDATVMAPEFVSSLAVPNPPESDATVAGPSFGPPPISAQPPSVSDAAVLGPAPVVPSATSVSSMPVSDATILGPAPVPPSISVAAMPVSDATVFAAEPAPLPSDSSRTGSAATSGPPYSVPAPQTVAVFETATVYPGVQAGDEPPRYQPTPGPVEPADATVFGPAPTSPVSNPSEPDATVAGVPFAPPPIEEPYSVPGPQAGDEPPRYQPTPGPVEPADATVFAPELVPPIASRPQQPESDATVFEPVPASPTDPTPVEDATVFEPVPPPSVSDPLESDATVIGAVPAKPRRPAPVTPPSPKSPTGGDEPQLADFDPDATRPG